MNQFKKNVLKELQHVKLSAEKSNRLHKKLGVEIDKNRIASGSIVLC